MKTALVTGGTKGIGKAISERLENIGYKVISADRTMGDLSTSEGINQLVSHVDGKLDLLVNNAAFTKYIDYKDLDSLDDDLYDKIFHVNLKAPFKLIKLLRPKFTSDASIINIASIAGATGVGSNIAYSATKAALVCMTKSFAKSLAPIRVNSISPGLIKTSFVRFPDEFYEDTAERTPLGRVGKPEDIADAVEALLINKYVTGEDFLVDGGRRLL